MTNEKIWTIKRLLEWARIYLSEKGIPDARLNAELMLCATLNYKNRLDLYLHFDKPLTQTELDKFKELLKRRLNREPIQYILGETEFMGLKFKVDRRVLIPRPETELLVESVIDICNKFKKTVRILDIGTGSGNISVSLAKFIEDVKITAIDSSKNALEVARYNITRHNVAEKVELKFLNIFDSVPEDQIFDVIVSNPPYVCKNDYGSLAEEIKHYEPKYAITDKSNGLSFHRRIAEVSRKLFKDFGWLFLEIAYNQKSDIEIILTKLGYFQIEFIRDYGGIDRVVKAKWAG